MSELKKKKEKAKRKKKETSGKRIWDEEMNRKGSPSDTRC